jgi:hypothetical protein
LSPVIDIDMERRTGSVHWGGAGKAARVERVEVVADANPEAAAEDVDRLLLAVVYVQRRPTVPCDLDDEVRASNPDDGRSLLVGLTETGLRRLHEAQTTHHQIVREMFLSRLDRRDLERLGQIWEKAMPGAVSSATRPL